MKRILPIIIVSQFLCTSLWFAGNAVMPDIAAMLHLESGFLAHQTSAVQFGFISGTLLFALLTVSDRFSPSLVFFLSSIFAALSNAVISVEDVHATAILFFRFLTGFFLAGIYPVGMKIASDYYGKNLGKSLGFLVGALVLGTAFPHLQKSVLAGLPWKSVIITTSLLSVSGGLAMLLFVPDGPFRKPSPKMTLGAFAAGFRNTDFRGAAFGYFGHMWELYSFWAFVPVMLAAYTHHYHNVDINIPLLSFFIIASGGVGCVVSGLFSEKFGAKNIASISLLLSCLCCVCSPLFLFGNSVLVLIIFLMFWGVTVVADSPLFSTLVARNAPEEFRGTSLTIVNCIGFSITIISIQLLHIFSAIIDPQYLYIILAAGPALGLFALVKSNRNNSRNVIIERGATNAT